jgi:hypothetical protein
MNDSSFTGRDPVQTPSEHVPGWTLELFAEEALPPGEQEDVAAHVASCAHCAAEVASHQALFAELAALPRLAPSPAFADLVMARVRVPQPSPFELWLQRVLPNTRREWMICLAALAVPAGAAAALVAWLISHPAVSLLSGWSIDQARTELWALFLGGAGWLARTGLLAKAEAFAAPLLSLSPSTWIVLGIGIAVATPLSAWALYRLLRAPHGDLSYAE